MGVGGEDNFLPSSAHHSLQAFGPRSLSPPLSSMLDLSFTTYTSTSTLIAKSCIHLLTTQLAPCRALGKDSARGLQKAYKWSLSHCRKASFAPGSQKVKKKKWQFTLIASPQKKEQSKSLWGKRGWSLCPPCSIGRETLWRKHLWDPRSMSTVSCNIHSEQSRDIFSDASWTFSRTTLLSLHSGHNDLPMAPGSAHSTPTLELCTSCLFCLKHSRCLCDILSHFPQVATQTSPPQGPSRMTISQIPYASNHPLYP